MINITYFGHSCFRVGDGKHYVLFDPYEDGSVPGLTLPRNIKVDYVYCSHQHHDHNAIQLVHSNNFEPFMTKKIVVPHDDIGGLIRGMNEIRIIHVEDTKIVHFGDIGRLITDKEKQELLHSDIVMIPVGGYYTIDVIQAKEIISQLQPKLILLMHYRNSCVGYDVLNSLENIKKEFSHVEEWPSEISFDSKCIPNGIAYMDIEQ